MSSCLWNSQPLAIQKLGGFFVIRKSLLYLNEARKILEIFCIATRICVASYFTRDELLLDNVPMIYVRRMDSMKIYCLDMSNPIATCVKFIACSCHRMWYIKPLTIFCEIWYTLTSSCFDFMAKFFENLGLFLGEIPWGTILSPRQVNLFSRKGFEWKHANKSVFESLRKNTGGHKKRKIYLINSVYIILLTLTFLNSRFTQKKNK